MVAELRFENDAGVHSRNIGLIEGEDVALGSRGIKVNSSFHFNSSYSYSPLHGLCSHVSHVCVR